MAKNYKQASFAYRQIERSKTNITTTKNVTRYFPLFNKKGVGVKPASAHIHALYNLLYNHDRELGIAVGNNNELLLEVNATNTDTRKVLVYDEANSTLYTGSFDMKGNFLNDGYVSVQYIALLHLIYLIRNNAELNQAWVKYKKDNVGNILLADDNSAILLDALYYSIDSKEKGGFPNFDIENEIVSIASYAPYSTFKDITKDIIDAPKGKFIYADIEKTKSKTRKTPKKAVTLSDLKNQYSSLTEDYFNSLPADQKELIPSMENMEDLNYFVVTDSFIRHMSYIADAIKRKDMHGMSKFSEGPKGTGKSLSAYATAYVFNLPMRILQGHKDISATDIIGGPIADEGTLKTYTSTAVLDTMRCGGLLLLDDFTYVPAGYTTILLGILDKPFSIKAADGEMVKRHPMSFIYTTFNPDDHLGANGMNQALRSRARIFESLRETSIPTDKIIDMVMNASGYPNRAEVVTMYECYNCIRSFIEDDMTVECSSTPCYRNLISWACLAMVEGSNPVIAAQDNIIPSLGFKTEEDERKIFTNVVLPRFSGKYSADFFRN